MAGIEQRNRRALTEFYSLYHARLFKFVYRLSRSHSIADELVNDVMLTVWNKAATFRRESRVSTWVFGIAYRQTLQRLSRKQFVIAPGMDVDKVASDLRDENEQRDWIEQALQSLPAAQKLAVVLVFYVGLSYEEVAEIVDCPVNTVKTRMFHARRKLRDELERIAPKRSSSGDAA